MRISAVSIGDALRALGRSEVPGVLLGLVAIFVVFDPGLLTPDSASMLTQAESGQISDWLSPTPTWMLSTFHVSGRSWFYLTVIAFLVVTSRLLARVCARRWAGVVAATIACLPPVLGWLSGLGRDTWCGVALLGAVLLATAPIPTSPRRRVGRTVALVATMWLALVARQNAVVAVAGVAAFAAVPFTAAIRGRWRRTATVLASAATSTLLLAGANSLLIDHVVRPARTYPAQATYVSDLAAISIRTGEMLVPDTVWNGPADVTRLAAVWNPADGTALYNVAGPPIHIVYDPDIVDELRRQWLRAIVDHPVAYARHRVRSLEVLLFESTEIGDPFIPGMGGVFPGHSLSRPGLAGDAITIQDWFWRLSGLRVWHVLAAGTVAAWSLRRSELARLAACLQVTGWLVIASLVPTAPGSQYRFVWMPVVASLVTVALALAYRRSTATDRVATRYPSSSKQ